MPLHLLGKKSWNVYNSASIARVKADEAAAAAKEAADEQRMQELDAERRAAILRGRTPPPLPDESSKSDAKGGRRDRERDSDGHDRKRRRLAGEDDTDRDIRLARKADSGSDDEKLAIVRLRHPKSDAPLTDHAGNINLFPVNLKEVGKRDKNAEAEKEKKRKERALEDQYTMRFSNASGKDGLTRPWYASTVSKANEEETVVDQTNGFPGFQNKDVWGREDPRRIEREQARITSKDPLAFMNKAQVQLKQSKDDKKKWADKRARELRELRAAQEREDRRERHSKRKNREHSDHKKRRRTRSSSRERESSPRYHERRSGERASQRPYKSSHQRSHSPDHRDITRRISEKHHDDRRH
ncbi:hypothetical protein K491DRAFT_719062 [Lophiostoma macrostomum CBS 122681]|uniref:CBF1-interacting co-repressor CIR N-terminal domain-containing protein n=1 Tax=Lophiostoma macrostomum CBS 122681 TaxID=1314788 RepID=A0A6A6T1A9_9PLEO|nr:hypothetical protein K491DRAFT_719062 [Lophiostoma macrostomum CBS 122681]